MIEVKPCEPFLYLGETYCLYGAATSHPIIVHIPKGTKVLPDGTRISDKERITAVLGRDWSEDFWHENGNYENLCQTCGQSFVGYKRRLTCKACALSRPAPEAATVEAEKICASLTHCVRRLRSMAAMVDEDGVVPGSLLRGEADLIEKRVETLRALPRSAP